MIGEHTSSRRWVKYEIQEAWKRGKGIVGIYIHKLENFNKEQANKGVNPFDLFYIDKAINYIAERSSPLDANDIKMSSVCKAYDSEFYSSKYVYDDIKDHIEAWIEEAIAIRGKYPK